MIRDGHHRATCVMQKIRELAPSRGWEIVDELQDNMIRIGEIFPPPTRPINVEAQTLDDANGLLTYLEETSAEDRKLLFCDVTNTMADGLVCGTYTLYYAIP